MMERHPLSAALPDMTEQEYSELLASVKKIGIQNPIILFEGMIVDGWHRYRASVDLDVDCPFEEIPENVNPKDFVIAQLTRRNLTSSQRALSVVSVNEWVGAGNAPKNQSVTGGHVEKKSIDEMANLASVSRSTIRKAKKIASQAVPEVIEAVKSGDVGIRKASIIASLDKDKQVEALNKPMKKAIEKMEEKLEDVAPEDDEIAINQERQRLDFESMNRLLDSDDKLAAAYVEIKQLNAELAVVKRSRDSYMNQCNEQIKMIKSLQKKLDKLTKE